MENLSPQQLQDYLFVIRIGANFIGMGQPYNASILAMQLNHCLSHPEKFGDLVLWLRFGVINSWQPNWLGF